MGGICIFGFYVFFSVGDVLLLRRFLHFRSIEFTFDLLGYNALVVKPPNSDFVLLTTLSSTANFFFRATTVSLASSVFILITFLANT